VARRRRSDDEDVTELPAALVDWAERFRAELLAAARRQVEGVTAEP
jgi:hypothetical protein